jgi:GAF domain/PucR C-terminal helix-turn-helix domain/GGDEF-like domain
VTTGEISDATLLVLDADGTTGPPPAGASGHAAARSSSGSLPPGALDRVFSTYRAIQASESDVGEVLRLTVHNAQTLLRADLSCVWRPSDRAPGRRGVVAASVGQRVESWAAQLAPDETGIGRLCVDLGRPVLAADYQAYADRAPRPITPYLAWSEGVATVLCLPLRESAVGAVGVLYVGRRRRLAFNAMDVELASALAGQAALALQNGRLRRELDDQHALLEHSARVADHLSNAADDDDGVDGVRRALEREIGRRVDYAPGRDEEPPAGVMISAVVAGRERYGDLHVYGRPLNSADAVSVERATSLVAREITRQRTLSQAQVRTGAQLLGSLLDGADPDQAHIAERARRINFDLRRPVTVVALAHDHANLAELHATATRHSGLDGADVLAAEAVDCALLAVATPDGWSPSEMAAGLLQRGDVRGAGISTTRPQLTAASDEAVACLSLALGAPDRQIVLADDLGPLAFMLGATNAIAQMQQHVTTTLMAVHAAQQRGGAPLLDSLDAYLSCGRRLAVAAESLGVHESTLKYRLSRIRGLVGPLDGRLTFDLWLGLRALELLRHLGHAAFAGADQSAED